MSYRVCCCSLPDLHGIQVCEHCANNKQLKDVFYQRFPFSEPFKIKEPTPFVITTPAKKTIVEKFDEKGNLIERITTEE